MASMHSVRKEVKRSGLEVSKKEVLKMVHITTAQWIMYLAPAVVVQTAGILAAVLVGRGSQEATPVAGQVPSERAFEKAA
jgi:hypothetical protein